MNIKHLEVKRAYYNDPENVVVQLLTDEGKWVEVGKEPDWCPSILYRIKPRTIRIGDIDVPEPVREPLQNGEDYFLPDTEVKEMFESYFWANDRTDNRLLARGMIHLTQEAAELHAKALILVSGGRVE